jgi:VanZ family protein
VTLATPLRAAWRWGPVAAYLALIFYLSAQSQVAWAGPYPDVVLHAAEYCVLAVLLARGLNDGMGRAVPDRLHLLTWTLCVLYAISDEIHQFFVPGRSSDWRDVLSDAAGAALGLAALAIVQRWYLLWRRTA